MMIEKSSFKYKKISFKYSFKDKLIKVNFLFYINFLIN